MGVKEIGEIKHPSHNKKSTKTPVSDEIFATINQAYDLQTRIKGLWVVGASTNSNQSKLISNAEGRLVQAIEALRELVSTQDGR